MPSWRMNWECGVGKRGSPEKAVHKAILQYLELVFRPPAIIHHSANEAALSNRDRVGAAIAMNAVKAMGMRPGFPDLVVLPYSNIGPLFFEVKAPGGRVSENQQIMIGRLEALGYRVAVVRSVDDVVAKLAEWGVWARPASQIIDMRGEIS